VTPLAAKLERDRGELMVEDEDLEMAKRLGYRRDGIELVGRM
jgi:hypothetical protein